MNHLFKIPCKQKKKMCDNENIILFLEVNILFLEVNRIHIKMHHSSNIQPHQKNLGDFLPIYELWPFQKNINGDSQVWS